MNEYHIPVLLNESVDYLVIDPDGIYFDATLGFGGHSSLILKKLSDKGRLIATDVDDKAFEFSKQKFISEDRISIYKFNYSMIDVIAKIESIDGFDGIIADLGVSSYQLDSRESGFTYRENTDLDLRMDKSIKKNASDVINELDEKQLADIFFKYGEEKNSKKIARLIVEKRNSKKITKTFELNEIINQVTPKKYLIKSLSRIYQALRIYVNDELGKLKEFLENGLKTLKSGGRFVIITYHSLEDRIVKEFFNFNSQKSLDKKIDPFGIKALQPQIKIITKKPVIPSEEEILKNNRSRSAKLRVAEKL